MELNKKVKKFWQYKKQSHLQLDKCPEKNNVKSKVFIPFLKNKNLCQSVKLKKEHDKQYVHF